jgi:hypothetical protein
MVVVVYDSRRQGPDLLTDGELPDGWRSPGAFRRLVARGLLHLEPWHILGGDQLRRRLTGLRRRYPQRRLIPFASRQDCDDTACWDLADAEQPRRVSIIHAFASAGWEQRAILPDLEAWIRRAVEDMLECDVGEPEE